MYIVLCYVWQAICKRNEFVEKERIHKVRAVRSSIPSAVITILEESGAGIDTDTSTNIS